MTSLTTDLIPFDKAVTEGKDLVYRLRKLDGDQTQLQLQLGELADRATVEAKEAKKIYGNRTLKKFAEAIGMVPCTLGRHRDTYRAWPGIRAPGRELRASFSVLRALAAHPDREQLVNDNPDMTQGKARQFVRDYKERKDGKGKKEEASADAQENRRWFRNLVADAGKLRGQADIGRVKPALLKEIEPKLLEALKEAGEVLIKLADDLQALVDREKEFDGAAPAAGTRRFKAPVNGAPAQAAA